LKLCLLIAVMLAACSPQSVATRSSTGAASVADATASATPFLPATPTTKVERTSIWIDPAVPAALRDGVMALTDLEQDAYILVEDASSAQVRVEAQPDRTLSQWIYAVVAAFPTVTDEITLADFQAIWTGSNSSMSLLVTAETLALLQKGFGQNPGARVEEVSGEGLLEITWDQPGSISVVPFEALEPRWKVLRLDGQSPVEKYFDPQTYPLVIPFGLSGQDAHVDRLAAQLDWPVTNRDPDELTVLVVTGVTALTRATAWQMERRGILYPGEQIGELLRQADITHISNEVSFWSDCPYPDPVQEGLKFCSDPQYFDLLESVGVDVVELTGNHNKDFGAEPFLMSLEMYQEAGWLTFGGGEDLAAALQPAVFEHNGNRIAFLGCNEPGPRYAWATESSPGAAPCSEGALLDEVRSLRNEGILPVFTFQWAELARPSEAQREAFRAAAQAGAVIVSGSQAHQPQAIEFEADAFIHYGPGNLFFDQMQSVVLRQAFIDRHVFYAGRHISTGLITTLLENYSQPRPMEPGMRAQFLEEIFEQSGW
jgi:poly-gamma-glutamate synthesis protein (capsule biosynthesis protein)